MHVDHLLTIEGLGITLVWGDEHLMSREIAGVTATDLEDPTRFLEPGEIVLSGLVWWRPDDGRARADRFVAALRAGGAVALLAGEETHGAVPGELVDACRAHRVALLSVPARTSFRAVTEAVYLRQWGDLSRRPAPHHALPENVRGQLSRLLELGAGPAELLESAFAHLGTPACHLLTSSGRTVARTSSAPALPAPEAARRLHGATGTTLRVQADATAYDAWHLHLGEADAAPPRVLHEIAEVLAQHRHRHGGGDVARERARAHDALIALIALADTAAPDADALAEAVRSCGLPGEGAYRVVVAAPEGGGRHPDAGRDLLAEALRHLRAVAASAPVSASATSATSALSTEASAYFALAQRPGGEAVAVVHTGADDELPERLREVWPLLHACRPDAVPHAGVSARVKGPAELGRALVQARYALAGARNTAPGAARVTAVDDLSTLEALLAGVPDDVRAAYRSSTLGPLLKESKASYGMLLETLEVFLGNNGSWARTAKALHLHVNTVHYRIQRVEALTGRDLSRLDHKLDLRAALLCR
ncbi:PucR family transcriptional regulator [Streptomyces aureoverticillatus]|uniref:PucR family transcriptional regulator n=1 Tax=Streptomyces aureoverticillatus TaxID=66871 RepID=UPI0013D9EAE6|nr:PucR family transcriptional regulator [Streptomyces aureoverticillatus]QIB43055.1 PucR family transcriptional regulator [Streptomyces aureoverticillatus]